MVVIVSVGAPPTGRELPHHADRAQSPRAWRPLCDGRLLTAHLEPRDPQVGAGGRAQDQHSVPAGRGALSRHPAPARCSGDPAGADVTWGNIKSRIPSASSGPHVHRARPVPASVAPADRGGTRT